MLRFEIDYEDADWWMNVVRDNSSYDKTIRSRRPAAGGWGMMTLDEALMKADDANYSSETEITLAAEVRRLREENEQLRRDAEQYERLRELRGANYQAVRRKHQQTTISERLL